MAEAVLMEDNREDFKRGIMEKADRFLYMVGEHVSGEAVLELSNAPKRIDTGLLKNSITFALDGEEPAMKQYSADKGKSPGKQPETGEYSGRAPKSKERCVYVGTNVEYAYYVHEGTLNMVANRFIKNAIEKNREQINRMTHQLFS